MNRVIITQCVVGFCHMQVCVAEDVKDKEILTYCNNCNPSGTRYGWGKVIRTLKDTTDGSTKKQLPLKCDVYPDRKHFLVSC